MFILSRVNLSLLTSQLFPVTQLWNCLGGPASEAMGGRSRGEERSDRGEDGQEIFEGRVKLGPSYGMIPHRMLSL